MTTMVEKMAKAISAENGNEYPLEHYVPDARAALTALLKPTAIMDQAALAELSDATVEDPKSAAWDAVRAYRAMIQAALDEREG